MLPWSEDQPCAVLLDPVVLKLSASTFSAALLPLPRSSPSDGVAVGVGVGVGAGLASAVGDAVKQASASRIDVNMIFGLFMNVFLLIVVGVCICAALVFVNRTNVFLLRKAEIAFKTRQNCAVFLKPEEERGLPVSA